MEARGANSLDEVDRAYELAAKIYGPNYFDARFNFARARLLEPLRNLEDAVVIVDNHQILGFVRILDRELHSTAGVIKAGGITSVCVHPDLQGQGWGLQVMEAALDRSRQRGDVFSILFARRAVDGWYPKLGYVGLGCHVEMRLEHPLSLESLPLFSGVSKPGVEQADIDIYARAYSDSYRDIFLSFHRDRDWWANLEPRLSHQVNDAHFVTLIEEDTLIGYFIASENRVIEAAALPEYRSKFMAGFLGYFQSSGDNGPVLTLPLGHWCTRAFRALNHSLSVRQSWDGGHMIRILDASSFKDIVGYIASPEHCPAIYELFQRWDVSRHEDARHLLLALAGAPPRDDTLALKPATRLIPNLPSWSAVDEL